MEFVADIIPGTGAHGAGPMHVHQLPCAIPPSTAGAFGFVVLKNQEYAAGRVLCCLINPRLPNPKIPAVRAL